MFSFISAVLLAAAPAAEVPLQPTDKWVVEFNDAQCIARREYGTPEQPLNLVLKQPAVGDVMQVAVIQQRSFGEPIEKRGKIQFDDTKPLEVSVLEFQPKGSKLRTNLINLPLDKFAAARSAKVVRFKTNGLNLGLALTQVGPLLTIMDQCVKDLREFWNANDDGGTKRQGAKGSLQDIFSGDDYPDRALYSEEMGTTAVAILIDERGNVADCSVIGTSGAAVLDAQTCAIVTKRAKFTPAIGLDGKPTKDAWSQRITWSLKG